MTVTRVLLQGTPVKLRNGQWDVKVLGPARKGDQVMVKAKNGKEWETTVTRVWLTGDDKFSNAGTVSICSDVVDVAAMQRRDLASRRPNQAWAGYSVKDLEAMHVKALNIYGDPNKTLSEQSTAKVMADEIGVALKDARERSEAAKTPEQKAADEVARLEEKANKTIGLLHQAQAANKPSTMRARGEQLGKILSKLDEAQQAAGVSDSERAATWEHKLEWAYS